jgi:hypothetical protein
MPRRATVPLAAFTLLVLVVAYACSNDSTEPALDPNGVAYSFVTVGCNRVAAGDTIGNISTANVNQLNRTFADIAALSPKPNFLFFTGDMVLGYTNDSTNLDKELKGWLALWQASPAAAAGIELVAVPGNHETENVAKVATAPAERVWLRDMAAVIARGGNGPGAGVDGYTTDQSKLTYSFDFKDAHFVTVSTDGVGKDWHTPTTWVASDLAAARARGVKHIFVFGHKPAYAYPTVPTDGLVFDSTSRNLFWTALATNQAEAMFSAHNHVYFRSQPTGHTWQIIAGNGGTALDAGLDPNIPTTGSYFGFTLVQVLNSGRVVLKSYGRDVPAAGYTAAVTGATTVRDSTEITWK